MLTNDDFPVYGNVTSIDQVERIQEYIDNKILDALSVVAGKLDLIIRGHTLAIGTIIEKVGKAVKKEQQRIDRVIRKHEKTAELATFVGIVGNHVPIDPGYPVPETDAPPIEEPFPYDPPTEPPVTGGGGGGGTTTCLVPPCPPTGGGGGGGGGGSGGGGGGSTGGGSGGGGDTPSERPDLPDIGDNQLTCDYTSGSVLASNRPGDGTVMRSNTIIYGGQLNTCTSLQSLQTTALDQMRSMYGDAHKISFIPGTQIPKIYTEVRRPYSDTPYRLASVVYTAAMPKAIPWSSSPYEETGQYLVLSENAAESEAYVLDAWADYPPFVRGTPSIAAQRLDADMFSSISNNRPDVG